MPEYSYAEVCVGNSSDEPEYFCLEFEVNVEDWIDWAVQAGIAPEVIGFIRFRPALLHEFDPEIPTESGLLFALCEMKGHAADVFNAEAVMAFADRQMPAFCSPTS